MKSRLHIDSRGNKFWKLPNGQLHREDGPAIEWVFGAKIWYKNGLKHREGGPAYIRGNIKQWFVNGELHRTNGPAHQSNFDNLYYIEGVFYEKELFKEKARKYKLSKILS